MIIESLNCFKTTMYLQQIFAWFSSLFLHWFFFIPENFYLQSMHKVLSIIRYWIWLIFLLCGLLQLLLIRSKATGLFGKTHWKPNTKVGEGHWLFARKILCYLLKFTNFVLLFASFFFFIFKRVSLNPFPNDFFIVKNGSKRNQMKTH